MNLNFPTVASIIAIVTVVFAVGLWVGNLESDRTAFKKFMQEISGDIGKIRSDITEIFKRLPPKAVAGSSPLQLTDLGKAISDELAAIKWAEQITPHLLKEVLGKHPYEIQEFCLEYVKNPTILTTPEDLNKKVQNCAYKHGITKNEVLRVLAVELRDEMLRQLGLDQVD